MKLFSLLTIICLLSFVYPLLLKYDSQDTNDGYIIFDSSSFGEGEEMHFNIKAFGIFISTSVRLCRILLSQQ